MKRISEIAFGVQTGTTPTTQRHKQRKLLSNGKVHGEAGNKVTSQSGDEQSCKSVAYRASFRSCGVSDSSARNRITVISIYDTSE